MAFPLHHCHKSCRWLVAYNDREQVDRTGHTVKEPTEAATPPTCNRSVVCWRLQLDHHRDMKDLKKASGIFFVSFYSASCLSLGDLVQRCLGQPVASQRQDLQQLYLADGRMLFTFTLSNAESRGGRMNLKVLANVRRGWTDCRAATLTFFFLMLTRRGRGLRERWDKILRWRHKFTAPTTMHVEEKQPECSQRHSKCEQEHEEAGSAVSDSTRNVPYRLDQSWSCSVHDGIFPDVYFYTQPLGRPHERRPMASRREQVSALFFVAWTQCPLTDSFPWATEGANPLKETPTFKKRIFWRPAPGSLPAGLNLLTRYWKSVNNHDIIQQQWRNGLALRLHKSIFNTRIYAKLSFLHFWPRA